MKFLKQLLDKLFGEKPSVKEKFEQVESGFDKLPVLQETHGKKPQ